MIIATCSAGVGSPDPWRGVPTLRSLGRSVRGDALLLILVGANAARHVTRGSRELLCECLRAFAVADGDVHHAELVEGGGEDC
jgi:hypothetical protein